MKLKIIICLLLFLSSAGLGYLVSLKYSIRVKQLGYLQSLIGSLETEILYYSTPLPVAMKRVAERSSNIISDFFYDTWTILNKKEGYRIDEAWQISILKNKDKTSFTNEDIEVIINFGNDLGIGNKEAQEKHFKFIRKLIEEQRIKALEEKNRNGTMFNKLGIILGLAIVIILF